MVAARQRTDSIDGKVLENEESILRRFSKELSRCINHPKIHRRYQTVRKHSPEISFYLVKNNALIEYFYLHGAPN